jgi:OOP family OmpA-OmpF porin
MPRKKLLALPDAVRLASVSVILIAVGCAHNTSTPPTAQRGPIGYVTDTSGTVVRSGAGGCVRTGFWEPQYATKECDPDLYAQAHPPEQKPAEVAAAPAPETQTAAARPEPEAIPAEPVRVYIGADTYFDFDRAELSSDAKRKLDTAADRVKSADEITVRIVGYADQIGLEDYNLSLSQRRADAVRTYLIEHGMPENALNVEARGETDPIVNCEGRQGATLIDCLQPNRRTEIEFSALEPLTQR